MATITTSGAIPATPQELRDAEVAAAEALSPGLTTNLPGSLIEDIASTAAGALVIQELAYTDLVNSISPYTANDFVLSQLGAVYGIQQGIGSNASVYVTFFGDPGYVIPIGFTVSDGNYQYRVQVGGIIESNGESAALYCVATYEGSWAIPIGTVTFVVTSVAAGFTLTCSNLTAGVPGTGAQSTPDYQAQVIQAGYVTAQGMPSFLKTILQKISGVQPRLVAVRTPEVGRWQVICGGGDPYAVANGIYTGLFDISNLIGSTLNVTAITQAQPPLITTDLNHGYSTNQVVQINGATGMTTINGANYVVGSVPTPTTFNLNVRISSITWASDVVTVVTTSPHGLTTSGTTVVSDCFPIEYNGTFTYTRVNTTTFTYPLVYNPGAIVTKGVTQLRTTEYSAYTGNGVLTPNLRNVTVSISDYPDSYEITFINPPLQTVGIAMLWNTNSLNYVSPAAISQLAIPALNNYINSIAVGEPINLFELQKTFEDSVASVLDSNLISRMVFTVTINGIVTSPVAGTGTIYGDPESYFQSSTALITVTQG
jgi:hypothetical protein